LREALALAPSRPAPPAGEIIPQGRRNATLTSLAGTMRRRGMTEAEILTALLVVNAERVVPSLPERDVRGIAKSAAKYAPEILSPRPEPVPEAPDETATEEPRDREPERPREASPWDAAVPAPEFLASTEADRDFLDPERRFFCPGLITEIFAPLGIAKSVAMVCLCVRLSQMGYRGLLIDRDNPRRILKAMLRGFGAEHAPRLKVISRENAPPLTDRRGWSAFPYAEYDFLVLDSLDSSTEGVGEQDSARPSLALAAILDVVHREQGPAATIIGNTRKDARSGRGSGVVGDRADIIYEVRDVTGFVPSGKRHWVEELPPASRDDWAAQNRRRAKRSRYRLAFINTGKFRGGEVPEPFVLEVRHDTEPWQVVDVTAELLGEGQRAQEAAQQARQAAEDQAVTAFAAAVREAPVTQRQAETFLMDHGVPRARARGSCTRSRARAGPGPRRGAKGTTRSSTGRSSAAAQVKGGRKITRCGTGWPLRIPAILAGLRHPDLRRRHG
jgi:Primase C terminal 1 (PriCT-1)